MNKQALFFKGFLAGIKEFNLKISLVANAFLLSIVYFAGIGITSIAARLFGKNFLKLKISKKQTSYWSNLNLKKKPLKTYYQQF